MRAEALKQIEGVGDDSRGSIADERQRVSYQVRRRLSVEEQALIGDACDVRGTDDATQRLFRALQWMPPSLRDFARDEAAAG